MDVKPLYGAETDRRGAGAHGHAKPGMLYRSLKYFWQKKSTPLSDKAEKFFGP
jgi:hypothetical protein